MYQVIVVLCTSSIICINDFQTRRCTSRCLAGRTTWWQSRYWELCLRPSWWWQSSYSSGCPRTGTDTLSGFRDATPYASRCILSDPLAPATEGLRQSMLTSTSMACRLVTDHELQLRFGVPEERAMNVCWRDLVYGSSCTWRKYCLKAHLLWIIFIWHQSYFFFITFYKI